MPAPKKKIIRPTETQPPQAQQPPVVPVATPPAHTVVHQPQAARLNQVLAGLVIVAVIGMVATIAFLAIRDNNGSNNSNSAPASGGQPTAQAAATQAAATATATQTTALTEDRVKQIATEAANQAVKDAGLVTRSDVKQIIDNAVAQAINAFQNKTAKTPDDVKQVATDTVTRQAQQAGGSSGGSWTPESKCSWLRANFPQTTSEVQALGAKMANVQTQRIRPTRYRCSTTTNIGVFDGYIIQGPNEGFQGAVTVKVPDHGRVDAYDPTCGAKYTGTPRLIAGGSPNKCDDTWAVDNGSVTALSMTVYPFNDENPPIGSNAVAQPGATPGSGQGQCVLGKDLAAQRGWILVQPQPTSVTQFGGAQVEVKAESNVPPGWEATTAGPTLHGGDLITPGFYSVYPPHGACRQQLGVQD